MRRLDKKAESSIQTTAGLTPAASLIALQPAGEPAWKRRAASKKERARRGQRSSEQRRQLTAALVGVVLLDALVVPVAARPALIGPSMRCLQTRTTLSGAKVLDDGIRFSPLFWNDNSSVQASNNCYNYATNHASNTFAQPGQLRGSDIPWPTSTCAQITYAVKYDGLFEVPCLVDCPSDHIKVAAAIATQKPHATHWYRQHASQQWTHKMGTLAATDKDADEAIILDVQTANRDYSCRYAIHYDTLCGCYCSPCGTIA